MPWKVSGVVEQRKQFIREYESGEWTMTDLCAVYGISRQSGYELLARYESAGEEALEEHSRAPRQHPNQTPQEIEEQVMELRQRHMSWGARKLKRVLERDWPELRWPASSTMGGLLKRAGLVHRRKRGRSTPPYTAPLGHAGEPNRVWCADFKGWFRTRDGERIDALTISDACSRYLLRCQAVEKADTERVRAIFEAAFREYGMPQAMRTDNGAPFASCALAGLSRLGVWLMKLGIAPERIRPGHPEQNGRHERMHRTLKQETASPPAANRRAQQRAFDQFRRTYNQERPHEALGMNTPAACYQVSPRPYPVRVAEPEYEGLQVRRVYQHGGFSWKHQDVFVSETLSGERIGLLPVDERHYLVYFSAFPIGCFDSERRKVRRLSEQERLEIEGAGEGDTPSPAPHPPSVADQKVSTMSPV